MNPERFLRTTIPWVGMTLIFLSNFAYSQLCIPGEWLGNYTLGYSADANGNIKIRIYNDPVHNKDKFYAYVQETGKVLHDWTFICRSTQDAVWDTQRTFQWYVQGVIHNDNVAGQYFCIRGNVAGPNSLVFWSNYMFQGVTQLPVPSLDTCVGSDVTFLEPAYILIKDKRQVSTCELTQVHGVFQAYYSSSSSFDDLCNGSSNSVVEVTGNNSIKIDTCYSGVVDYHNPLRGVTLTCVDDFYKNKFLGDTLSRGFVIAIFGNTDVYPGQTVFYCAKIDFNLPLFKWYISLDTTSTGDKYACDMTQTETSATDTPTARYRQLVVNAFGCDDAPCINGGTCLRKMGSKNATCQCPRGTAGQQCELLLNPCGNNPCMYGAACSPNNTDFICDCPPQLTGKTCETVVALPTGQNNDIPVIAAVPSTAAADFAASQYNDSLGFALAVGTLLGLIVLSLLFLTYSFVRRNYPEPPDYVPKATVERVRDTVYPKRYNFRYELPWLPISRMSCRRTIESKRPKTMPRVHSKTTVISNDSAGSLPGGTAFVSLID